MFGCVVSASADFQIGDYFIIGQYNNTPILWRYAVDDQEGKLLLSDKVISFKRYSSPNEQLDYYSDNWNDVNFWETSNLKAWLNSSSAAGHVAWLNENPPNAFLRYSDLGYAGEAGFLSIGNFTQAERNLMKTVTQWTMLPQDRLELSENGLDFQYDIVKSHKYLSGSDGHDFNPVVDVYYDVNELPTAYYGAAYKSTDTVFLLDELQIYSIWKNFGSVDAIRTDESNPDEENAGQPVGYSIRTGFTSWTGTEYGRNGARGVRPAFYLNELAVGDYTGSGTADDPYVLTGNSDYISVSMNSEPIAFDVAPIMENDRVLVPFRAIFEAFGADVRWEESTNTVTATKDETSISLQIGNNQMTVNGKVVTLDVPPQIISDRTLVPIRAVSEGLGANVEWDDENKTVVITTE
jgi:hypothetical protein